MKTEKVIFWNVDTQVDFISPQGKLYVPGAELLKPVWAKLTRFAKLNSVTVVNTADWHYPDSEELSANPDFITTFPLHCMANTPGAELIEETTPENPLIIDWNKEMSINQEQISKEKYRNFLIRKDAFDVFRGNRLTDKLLQILSPELVVVYGVTTNVCVNDAVLGLIQRVKNVMVVEDAIKELPNIPLPFDNWKKLGVELLPTDQIISMFENSY